jgi:hypothetical protein
MTLSDSERSEEKSKGLFEDLVLRL